MQEEIQKGVENVMRARCLNRQIGEKEVLKLFALGSAVLLALSQGAERYEERRAAADCLRASASAVATFSRRTFETRSAEAVAVPQSEHSPAAAAAGYRLSDAERGAYFSLIAALDIQGRPAEFAHIFMGTIRQESSFNPRAMHPVSGAKGLSQLMAATGAAYGLSRAEFFEPVPNLQAFVEYFYSNFERFTNFTGVDSTGKRAIVTRDQAIKYSLIAHNLGPSALEGLMARGFCEEKADRFIRLLEKRIATNEPLRYHNRYNGGTEQVTVSKMIEVVDFYDRIMAFSGWYRTVLARDDDPPVGGQVASSR